MRDVYTDLVSPPPPPPSVEATDLQGMKGFGVVTITRSVVEVSHKGAVIAADWLPAGDKFVTGSWDNSIKEWALETGRCTLDLNAGNLFTNLVV